MKFGDSLTEGLVPEWKDLYVDYKAGKKLIKKVTPQENSPLLETPHAKYQTNDSKEPNFIEWLDAQKKKVDSFYMEKESEAYTRFLLIQDQLYQLKEHKASISKNTHTHPNLHPVDDLAYHTKNALDKLELPSLPSMRFLQKWRRDETAQDDPIAIENRVRNGGDSSYSTDLDSIDSEVDNRKHTGHTANRGDYVRSTFSVPYLYARKQLKNAILEHYRALSLLKSFRILNRTAFRKITKKYDKATGSAISGDFMEKLDKEAYFMTSELVDKCIGHVEELYIAFYDPETTDRKHSLEKLKSIAYAMSGAFQPTFYGSTFTNGLFLGFAVPLLTLGIYTGVRNALSGKIPEEPLVLQIWGGFFFLNLVFLLFGINMLVFEKFKINYKFIFEFNLTTALSYKQYLVIPAFGMGFLALLSWFSFNDFWPTQFPGRDWPWIYFGVMMAIFLWPGNQFYGHSRRWLQIALWRLLLSGLYPVEFRDFFLGDILCSLTYTMGNLAFFFCLYAHHWNGLINGDKSQDVCGSSKSRLMGFFSALPSIFRFLQCVRRYMDTGDWFPHLANMSKYGISTIYYCLLSVYRIKRSTPHRAAFIFFAAINSIYTSAWDIVMDWSLLQSGAKHFLLRDHLFFGWPGYYYAAMVVDVVLRFQWIFYAFFASQIQQSAITSFCIALAEIVRRFIWVFFRMENEHCTNVTLFRASKDSPLPYTVTPKVDRAIRKLATVRMGGMVRRRSTLSSLSGTLNRAHVKDFQRRKTVVGVEESDDE